MGSKKPNRKPRKRGPVVKPQPTLRGYDAWVIERLALAQGLTPSETTAWVVNQWVMDSREKLESEFGIKRRTFQIGENPVDFNSWREGSDSREKKP